MSDAGHVAAGDGRPPVPPGTAAAKGRRQRRPTGAPPPLPHPVTITTTAWLVLAALVLAGAFAASQHTPWLRMEDRASTWLLRQLSRPRPYGVTIIGSWAGYAGISPPLAVLTIFLMGIVYCLAAPGRALSFQPRSALVQTIQRTEGLTLCGRDAPCPG